MSRESELLRKVDCRKTLIEVVGVGYVDAPLAITFAEAGFSVQFRRLR